MNRLKVGSLEAFVAKKESNIIKAQELRYRVFVEEMGFIPSEEGKKLKRDFDKFDDWCDHLLVRDTDKEQIVGAYRILRRSQLPEGEEFYTQGEFDLTKPLTNFTGEVMELGRSCVDQNYRDRATMQLLWKAIGEYVNDHNIELMFGCASFPGADSKQHVTELSYLYSYHAAPEELQAKVHDEFYRPIDLLDKSELNPRRNLAALPPLIKGYLRLGGLVGEGAFEDTEANTTDVCIMVDSSKISDKYRDKFAVQEG